VRADDWIEIRRSDNGGIAARRASSRFVGHYVLIRSLISVTRGSTTAENALNKWPANSKISQIIKIVLKSAPHTKENTRAKTIAASSI
jgi:hypothetical protein